MNENMLASTGLVVEVMARSANRVQNLMADLKGSAGSPTARLGIPRMLAQVMLEMRAIRRAEALLRALDDLEFNFGVK